jgi:Transposase zinc-ribbon domain
MEFQERFATEAACLDYLAASRWPEGFVCPGCGGCSAWVLERRHLWQCSECALQTSVTAGTVMHKTRTPLRTWFWAAYLIATHYPGISAKQLQRQLGLSRYETAWLILQKLKRAMIAPERESLGDEVEVDEFFLGGLEEGRKGGRQPGQEGAHRCRRRGSRSRLGTATPASPGRRPRRLAARIREGHHRCRRDRPHGRVARLRRAHEARLRAPATQPASRSFRRAAATSCAPCRQQPEGLDARNSSRRL